MSGVGRAGAVLALTVSLGVAVRTATAEFVFAVWLQNQSPDGRLVELNGVCIPAPGATTAWWYLDWDDGTYSSAFFPATHRYAQPGQYTITGVAYDDLGHVLTATSTCNVPEPPQSEIATVVLAQTALGLRPGQVRSVQFSAYDAQGTQVPLTGHDVQLYAPQPNVIDITVETAALTVTALDLSGGDAGIAWVYIYVDQIECAQPLVIVVNSHPGDFATAAGAHSLFYLPQAFFDQAYVSPADHALVMDLAYDAFAVATHFSTAELGAPPVQGISYSPPVYGSNGNPLLLGDYALPAQGCPHFGVLFHELAHNYQGTHLLLNSGGASGALYQETLSEWHVQYACWYVLAHHLNELSLPARAALLHTQSDNAAYHAWEMQNYISQGMPFNFGTIMPSHVLVAQIYDLCTQHGWDRLERFYGYFDIRQMAALADVYAQFGGGTHERRLAALLAVLGLTFDQDVRPIFRPLAFPIDDTFHDAVWLRLRACDLAMDGDCDVDAIELAVVLGCLGGPDVPVDLPCDASNLDTDNDVDLLDIAGWQAAYTGTL